eukprot:scaffold3941_cov209-Pinguiococcus_pyrenoidosus.AAC.1
MLDYSFEYSSTNQFSLISSSKELIGQHGIWLQDFPAKSTSTRRLRMKRACVPTSPSSEDPAGWCRQSVPATRARKPTDASCATVRRALRRSVGGSSTPAGAVQDCGGRAAAETAAGAAVWESAGPDSGMVAGGWDAQGAFGGGWPMPPPKKEVMQVLGTPCMLFWRYKVAERTNVVRPVFVGEIAQLQP